MKKHILVLAIILAGGIGFSTGGLEVTSGALNTTSLSIVNDSYGYEANYSSFSVEMAKGDDPDYPTLTIDGTVNVYDGSDGVTNGIVFSVLSFSQTLSRVESISGVFSIDGSSYTVGGSGISRDSDFYWTGGLITINAETSSYKDCLNGYVTITVTLDGTTATLTKTSEEWDIVDWCQDRLIPSTYNGYDMI
jgi:hypothetical protein